MEHSTSSLSGVLKFALTALTVLACSSAPAQWLWIDAAGNKVFSDTAPAPDVPEKNILKRPGMRSAPAAVVDAERKKLADGQAKLKAVEEGLAKLG